MYEVGLDLTEIMGAGYVKADDSLKALSDKHNTLKSLTRPQHKRFGGNTISVDYVTILDVTGTGVLNYINIKDKNVGEDVRLTIDGSVYLIESNGATVSYVVYKESELVTDGDWITALISSGVSEHHRVQDLIFRNLLKVELKSDGSNLAYVKGIYLEAT